MNNAFTLVFVIAVAFLIGYVLVSMMFARISKARRQSTVMPVEESGNDRRPSSDDQARYREVLGLGSPYTWGELERQYQMRLAECSPERLKNLGDEVHQVVAGRLALINEAYENLRNPRGPSSSRNSAEDL